MIKPVPDPTWPESWKLSYQYDLAEVFGEDSNPGYVCAYQNRRDIVLELCRRHLPPGVTILDVAAGQGNFSIALDEMGYDVVWNDLREELMDYVLMKHGKETIRFRPGNFLELDGSRRFEAILMLEFIEHAAHPDWLLKHACELLKPEGFLILSTPNGHYFRNKLPKFSECLSPEQFESIQYKPNADGHIFLLHEKELIQMAVSSGLLHLETRRFNNPLTAGALGLNQLAKRLPRRWILGLERMTWTLPKIISERIFLGAAYVFKTAAD